MTAALRPALLAAFALIAGTGVAQAQGRGGPERSDREEDYRRADTARVVATELAFARAAQDDGQWTAFAEYATDDAVMFVPERVNAQTWLRGRANPAQAVRWQPYQVWSSCDGSLAVTRGAWQRPDGSVGYFTTVWERQEKDKDGYRWVLDQGDVLEEPLAAPEMIEGNVADCPQYQASSISEAELADRDADALGAGAVAAGSGWAADGTLAYSYAVQPSGARELVVLFSKNGNIEEVVRSEVAAP